MQVIFNTLYVLLGAFGIGALFLGLHALISVAEAKNAQALANAQTEKAKLRNEHIQTALAFADQVVSLAEKTLGTGGEKEKYATDLLNKRLQDNGLSGNFTPDQIEGYIKAGVDTLKAKGLEIHAPKAEVSEAK
ncbi:phage holin, LLH family [Oenococcus oeni]|uniref:phage holin, LLH family n=1 Tax=Oenococcus oeni TaxID=1247 RepID=UPI003EE69F08